MKILLVILLVFFSFSCTNKEGELSPSLFSQPENFDKPVYDFSRNQITKEGFELGRKLFYEPMLSRDNTISCGSCHIQSAAFTHHGHDVSHGVDDRLGTRNPISLINLAWSKSFFWDGGVFDLDLTSVPAITSAAEMDETVPNVIQKLRKHNQYPGLFKRAFGTEEITDERFFKALSQFMLTLVSTNSKYDRVSRNEPGFFFTEEEKAGHIFFKKNCASCHSEPTFTNNDYRNNGLQPIHYNDLGRYEVTLNSEDKYKFKIPTLRNLSYTGPYMHDGRFLTLDRVMEHYRSGMVNTGTLDSAFVKTNGITMTDTDKSNLLAFLKTLNDPDFVRNPLYAESAL